MTTETISLHEQSFTTDIKASDVTIGLLSFLTFVGMVAGVGRLVLGLGFSTALTDGYPWGIWIGFDFALIAFSGTGFTMAAVVHVLHLKKYQPALRPAIMAGLLGYTSVLMLLVLDLGRPDRFYNFIIFWNLHSPLFEISWCILLYTTVLCIETSPYLFERLNQAWLVRLAYKLMAPVTIIGVTLSTLHQSTLGTLYLNMPHRLDALWYTPILPLLFFVSSIMAGLSLAIIAYKISTRILGKEMQSEIVNGLAKGLAWIALAYVILKLGDILLGGEIPALLAVDRMSFLLWLELGLGAVVPMILLLIPAVRAHWLGQWVGPVLILFGVFMSRFNATMFAQLPPPGTVYSPHVLEWLSTIGILAGAALVWSFGNGVVASLPYSARP